MKHKALALALTALLATTMVACSSSDNATKIDDTDLSSPTSEDTTTTTAADTTTSSMNLGGLDDTGSSTSGEITPANIACMTTALQNDPTLSAFSSFEEVQAGTQADSEAFYTIFIDCVGKNVAIDFFMEGFSSQAGGDEAKLDCTRATVTALSDNELVQLLSGDPVLTQTLTTDILTSCF